MHDTGRDTGDTPHRMRGVQHAFWRTVGASTDTAPCQCHGTRPPERTKEGMLRITDPTEAWLEVQADGTSDLRPASIPRSSRASPHRRAHQGVGRPSKACLRHRSARSPTFLLRPCAGIRNPAHEHQKLKGSLIPIRRCAPMSRDPLRLQPGTRGDLAAILLCCGMLATRIAALAHPA